MSYFASPLTAGATTWLPLVAARVVRARELAAQQHAVAAPAAPAAPDAAAAGAATRACGADNLWPPGLEGMLLGVWLALVQTGRLDARVAVPRTAWPHPSMVQLLDQILQQGLQPPLTGTAIPFMVTVVAEGGVVAMANPHLSAAAGLPPLVGNPEQLAAVLHHVSDASALQCLLPAIPAAEHSVPAGVTAVPMVQTI